MLLPPSAPRTRARLFPTASLLALALSLPLCAAVAAHAAEDADEARRPVRAARYLVPLAPGVEWDDLAPGYGAEGEEGEGEGPQMYDTADLDPDPNPGLVSGVSFNYRAESVRSGAVWRPGKGADVEAQGVVVGIAPLPAAPAGDWFATGPAAQLNSQTPGARAPVSGRVAGLAAHPTDPNTFYVASAGGGVWKTTNGGSSFTPLTDFQPNTATGAVAVAPSDGQIVWVGTGEANYSLDSRYGSGLLKSTDGGLNWLVVPGPSNAFVRRAVSRIVIHPTDPNVVYVAVSSGSGGVGGGYGVWRTGDGGTTWTNTFALPGNPGTSRQVTDLILNPAAPNTLYAAYTGTSGGTGAGIYKTTNGGTNWALVDSSLPSTTAGRTALALCAAAPDTVYASISTTSGGGLLGVYKTTTGGTAPGSWTQLTVPLNYQSAGQGWYNNTIAVSPTDPNFVFCAGSTQSTGSVVGSPDGGTTWYRVDLGQGNAAPHVDHHALEFLPNGRLLNGNDGGVWRLENAMNAAALASSSTIQWTNLNTNINTIQFTGVALHPTQTVAFGGSQDNGTARYNGTTWSLVVGGDGGFARVDQSTPTTVYQSRNGITLSRSDNGGTSFAGKSPSGATGGLFYPPYILDQASQTTVLYGVSALYRSTNRGDAWTAIATSGAGGYVTASGGSPGNVRSIGAYGGTIYAGTTSGDLFVTTNTGTSWSRVTPVSGTWQDIFVNPNYPADVYAVRGSFTGSSSGHVYRSTNGGANWTDISGNIKDQPYNAVKLDQKSGTLYVGGDDGVYYSTNFGSSWSRLGTGLPRVQVVDLVLSPGNGVLGAGTHGRGMWTYPLETTVAAPVLYPQPGLSRDGSNRVLVTLNLRNSGNGDTTGVNVTSVTVNGLACTLTSGTSTVGTVPASAARAGTGVWTSPVTAPAGTSLLVRIQGTTDQGGLYASLRMTAP